MENTNDSNIGAGDILNSLIMGFVSGVAVYVTYNAADGVVETASSFVCGAVFGAISSFYFFTLTRQFLLRHYVIWTLASFLSFCLAYWVFWWLAVAELVPTLPAAFGVSGFVGAIVLVIGFRFSFLKLPIRDFKGIILLLTFIPTLPYLFGLDSHTEPPYFILFTVWQTAAILFFANIFMRNTADLSQGKTSDNY